MVKGREITDTGQPLDIYKAKLTFTRASENSRAVTVQIRYSKKERERKNREEKLPFPEDINENDLVWSTYRGEEISIYLRGRDKRYKDMDDSIVHTDLGQRLEKLVRKVYFKNSV